MQTGLSTLVSQVNLRHAFGRRLRTMLTIGGVAAGVMLAVSISLINATLLSSVRDSARQLAGAAEIEVGVPDRTGMPEATVDQVASVEGVDQAIPMLRNYATVMNGERQARIMVVGVTPQFPSLFPRNLGSIGQVEVEGGFGSGNGLMLSKSSAEKLGVGIGDGVVIETRRGFETVAVSGLASGGPLSVFNGGEVASLLMPAAQNLFDREGFVDSVYVIVDPKADLASIEDEITAAVGENKIVGQPGARGTGFGDALHGINAITTVAGTVALFVAGFVVFNTMSMSLAERRKEISMTLVFGATRKQIFASFLIEALILGLIAAVIGVVAGILLASFLVDWALAGLRVFSVTVSVPLKVTAGPVALGAVSGILVAIVGALLPARRVLSVAPVEALRPHASYEWAGNRVTKRGRVTRTGLGLTLMLASTIILMRQGDTNEVGVLTNAWLILGLIGTTLLLPSLVPLAVDILKPLVVRVFGAPGRLAMDALRTNAGRTTVTAAALIFTLGIAVGVASALTSYERQWHRSAGMWFGAPLYVQPESFETLGADQPLPADLASKLEQVPGVQAALPERYRIVNVGGRQTTLYVIPYKEAIAAQARYTPDGNRFREEIGHSFAKNQVVVSYYMAKKRNLEVGDTVKIPTPSGQHSFIVGGFQEDLNPLDSMYIDGDDFVRLWGEDSADRFEITLDQGASVGQVREDLEVLLGAKGLAAEVTNRKELITAMFDQIRQTFSVASAIQLDALIVAALAIANTMFIAIFERRWELGLQQTLGMSRRQMGGSLLLEAGVIGLIGGIGATLLGIGIGILMLQGMASTYAFSIAFYPSWSLAGLALGIAVTVAGLAGLYPTRTAVKVPIIESLRYE